MLGDALALASAMAFSFGNVAIAKATRNRSVDSGVLLSVLMTGALAILGWLLERDHVPVNESVLSPIVWFGAAGILATVWGRVTLFKAIQFAGVLRATAIRRITPFLSVLFGWLFLADRVSGWGALGLAFISVSFGLLYIEDRKKLGQVFEGLDLPLGYMFGIFCALLYASSYVVRKRGLELLPDAYLGALIGSGAALIYYMCSFVISSSSRQQFTAFAHSPDVWQVIAAFSISVGQILLFAALNRTTVTRVAMISSTEIFISAYLAVIVFRTEKGPSITFFVAMLLSTAGVLCVAAS